MACLIQACVRNGHSRLESLSEATESYQAIKKSSLLQQSKRWLNNKWTDWESFYLPFAKYFLHGLAAKGELVFIIDGTQTGHANTTLMISVLCKGFAIPPAWVVKKGEKGHFPKEYTSISPKLNFRQSVPCLLGTENLRRITSSVVHKEWMFVVRTLYRQMISMQIPDSILFKPPVEFTLSLMAFHWQTLCTGVGKDTPSHCFCCPTWNWDARLVITTNAGSR